MSHLAPQLCSREAGLQGAVWIFCLAPRHGLAWVPTFDLLSRGVCQQQQLPTLWLEIRLPSGISVFLRTRPQLCGDSCEGH